MTKNIIVGLTLVTSLVTTWASETTSSFRAYEDATRRLKQMEYMAVMAPPALQCYIENGFDYVDSDVANAPSPTAEGCCSICAQTRGCGAFAWTTANGGTCWLKSGRGQIVVNPYVKSALLWFGNNPVCVAQQDVDFVGNDLTRVDGASADKCCDLCHNFLGCRAYSWSNYLGGSCWLKSKGDQTAYKPGVISAQAYPISAPPPSCALQMDTDFVDNDIGNAPSSDAGGCCQICRDNPNCRAFAWSGQNGGTCWLKSAPGTAVSSPGVIAAVIPRDPPPPCTLSYDLDYVDNDLDNRPSSDAQGCCGICRAYSGCKAFTWSTYNGGTCWLKSKAGQTTYKPGVQSATV